MLRSIELLDEAMRLWLQVGEAPAGRDERPSRPSGLSMRLQVGRPRLGRASARSKPSGDVAVLGWRGPSELLRVEGCRSQGKGKLGELWGSPPPFSNDRTLRVTPRGKRAVFKKKKKERPRTPTRERCERATLTTTDLSKKMEYEQIHHILLINFDIHHEALQN